MSSIVQIPGPEDDYALPLNQNAYRAVLNGIFLSISQRLKALELTEADYETAIGLITTQALAIVSASITDEVDAQRLVLAQIQESADAIAEAYEALIGSGVPASSVSLAAIAGFTPTNVQAGIAALVTAVGLLSPKESPSFTGNPTSPTPAAGDNDDTIATTAFVQGEGVRLAFATNMHLGG